MSERRPYPAGELVQQPAAAEPVRQTVRGHAPRGDRSRTINVMTDSDHDELVQRQFGASAEGYRTSASHARGRSLARLLELVAPHPGWVVLDVATGAGHTAATLAPHVDTVIAGDMTREMLEQADIVRREQGRSNIRFVQESAQELAYRDRVFDLVVCRVAAHHFPHPERFVRASARVLKPGGILVVIDNVVPDDPDAARWINDFERRRDPSHARCLSVKQWQERFAANGLAMQHREVSAKWFDFHDWMRRMNVPPETLDRLGRELLDAPGEIRDFWRPQRRDGRIALALQEAILVAVSGR